MVDAHILVNPSDEASTALPIIVERIGDGYLPLYKMEFGGDGVATKVEETAPLPVRAYGPGGIASYIDPYSGAIGAIEQEHLQIHEGKGYTFAERLTIDDAGGANPVHDVLIKVPANSYPHLRHIIITTKASDVDVDLYEDTIVSANGSAKTIRNNNRNSDNTPDVEIYNNPTVTDEGNLLEPILLTGTKQSGAFGSDGANEWNLKTNANSMLRITNNTPGAGSSKFVVNFFWYE